jgi:hypothetical protein
MSIHEAVKFLLFETALLFRFLSCTLQMLHCLRASGTDVMILKIFSPKNSAKNWRFLLKTNLNYARI